MTHMFFVGYPQKTTEILGGLITLKLNWLLGEVGLHGTISII
jgi:hypothetical protein